MDVQFCNPCNLSSLSIKKKFPEALAPRDLSHFLAIKHNHFLRGIC